MANTLNEIMDELLVEYEKNPNIPVEEMLKAKLEEKGLGASYSKLVKAMEYIDKIDDNMQCIQTAHDDGIESSTWLKRELDKTLKDKSAEEKSAVLEAANIAMKNVEIKMYNED